MVPVEGSAGVRSPWGEVSREVDGLDAHARYEMWVKASTRVGEGVASRVVSQAPSTTGKNMFSILFFVFVRFANQGRE